jgi:hypothetical protein
MRKPRARVPADTHGYAESTGLDAVVRVARYITAPRGQGRRLDLSARRAIGHLNPARINPVQHWPAQSPPTAR